MSIYLSIYLFPSATIWAQGERIHLDRCSASFVLIALIVSFRIEVICMLDECFARNLSELVATVRALIEADKYPRTAAALDELQNAVGAEFKRYFRKRMATFRTKQNKIAYLNRKVSALQRQVRSHTENRSSQPDHRLDFESDSGFATHFEPFVGR